MNIKLEDLTVNEIKDLLLQFKKKTGLTLEIVVNVIEDDSCLDIIPFDDSLLEFLKSE